MKRDAEEAHFNVDSLTSQQQAACCKQFTYIFKALSAQLIKESEQKSFYASDVKPKSR